MYQSREIKSFAKTLLPSELKKETEIIKQASALIYYYDRLLYLEKFTLIDTVDFDAVVRLRIFNEESEIYVWRSNGLLKGRVRTDIDGITDGVACETLLHTDTENRLALKDDFAGKSAWKKMLVRNYAKYNQSNQYYYFDARLIKLL